MLQRYGLSIGMRLVLAGRIKHAYGYLVLPVNYWRDAEYRLIWDESDFRAGQKVLDISSPKLMPLFLAHKVKCNVVSTDIEDYFIEEMDYFKKKFRIPDERLQLGVEDGRKLSFEDNSFERVFSISVLEHIPEDGDTQCIKEIARVLAPGGRAVITLPYGPEYKEEYQKRQMYWADVSQTDEEGLVFFQKRYNRDNVMERIVDPSGLRLRKMSFVGDKLMVDREREFSAHLPLWSGPFQPMISRLFHSGPTEDHTALKRPLCVMVSLEKPE